MKAQLILGFDFGIKYIGVAIGQTTTLNARPLTSITVKNRTINRQTIDQLIKEWKPSQLIVGIPIDINNNKQQSASINIMKLECLKFFDIIQTRYKLPTHKVDETLSTWEAKKSLSLIKTKYSPQELLNINAQAAAILIQQWFHTHYKLC